MNSFLGIMLCSMSCSPVSINMLSANLLFIYRYIKKGHVSLHSRDPKRKPPEGQNQQAQRHIETNLEGELHPYNTHTEREDIKHSCNESPSSKGTRNHVESNGTQRPISNSLKPWKPHQ